jgi:simple sugar transport system permease protein
MSRALPEGLRRTLRRFAGLSAVERVLVSGAAVVVALLVGAVMLLGSGYVASCREPALFLAGTSFCFDPVAVYAAMYQGAFGTPVNQALTLQRMTLLIFTGLAFAIPYRAGLFNIGAQGQFVLAALATTVSLLALGPLVSGPVATAVLVPVGLLAGAVVGGLYGLLPGVLKTRYGTNEVISTLLLNFIATGVAVVIVKRAFNNPEIQGTVTRSIPEAATLQPWLFPPGTRFSVPVLAATLLLVGGFWWLLNRTTLGYDIRVLGRQQAAAVFGGVDDDRVTVLSMVIAGAVAGLGGGLYVMMVVGRWQVGLPALGFDGIAVSVLAGNNPVGLVPAGLLFGALQSGGLAINFQLGIPRELVDVLRGLVILLVATPELFRIVGRRLQRQGRLRPAGGESG